MTNRKKLLIIAGVLALSACSTPMGPSTDSALVRQPGTETRPLADDDAQQQESARGKVKPVIDS